MFVASSSPSVTWRMTEREWDKLVNLVLEGCVVPVVGPELLVSGEAGHEQLLYNAWGEALAEQVGLPIPEGEAPPSLYDVTNALSLSQNPNELAYDIDDVIRRRPWPMPDALRHLAEISSFSLYITTTVDHQFESALAQARGDRQRVEQVVFTPRGAKRQVDLPGGFEPHECALFHLFGATSPVDGTFAKTEDDLIEFSWSLLDQQYSPEHLYDYLQKKTVLLLGCSFPDWLGRFFIHALNAGHQQETINIYYVSTRCESGLTEYLKRRRAKVLTTMTPPAFVAELHRRWRERYTDAPAGALIAPQSAAPAFKNGAVFLSYASEDRQAVKEIRAQLEAANIDTWMDERALEPGEDFQQSIRENIRNASFFVAIISRSLDGAGSQARYLWKEWKWAEDASLERRKEDRYLQPLVIDGTPPGAPFIDPPYRDLHWTRLRDGRLPEDFIETLARGIRRFRRSR